MPSTPRGRDAATICAVILTFVFAFAWLRSSDGAPAVPSGLSIATQPAAALKESAARDDAEPPAVTIGGERAGGERRRMTRRGHADRAGGAEDARARPKPRERARRGAAGDAGRQDPPATTPAPKVGRGPAGAESGVAGSGGRVSAPPATPAAPEFALE